MRPLGILKQAPEGNTETDTETDTGTDTHSEQANRTGMKSSSEDRRGCVNKVHDAGQYCVETMERTCCLAVSVPLGTRYKGTEPSQCCRQRGLMDFFVRVRAVSVCRTDSRADVSAGAGRQHIHDIFKSGGNM